MVKGRYVEVIASLLLVAVTLSGCGGGGGTPTGPTAAPTPAPPPAPPVGPCDCPDSLKRGHCGQCNSDGKDITCTKCAGIYTLDPKAASPATTCTYTCPTEVADKPGKGENAQSHNGVVWPSVCYQTETSHSLLIGDWGGFCGWNGQHCVSTAKSNDCKALYGEENVVDGQPCPMPNRGGGHGPWIKEIEGQAQKLVSDRMVEKVAELKKKGTPAQYIINVGDNFYPGGVDVHCGTTDMTPGGTQQFAQVWKEMYPGALTDELEWWSVLGNHDYGGVCYIKGWEQQIFYTWANDKWVMPGQYWMRSVQHSNMKIDFFFIDGNRFDTTRGTSPGHDLCNPGENPSTGGNNKCLLKFYPGDGGNCAPTGPHSSGECHDWFDKVWNDQYHWLVDAVHKSEADWQIVVNHYPATFNQGTGGKDAINWAQWLPSMGIDLMISGHTHEQKIYYGDFGPGRDMKESAWVITGGGGGVTTEMLPVPNGEDDAYGYMEMEISLDAISIKTYSHGGRAGKNIMRNSTSVKAVPIKPDEELLALGLITQANVKSKRESVTV